MKQLIGYVLVICLLATGCGGASPTATATLAPEVTVAPSPEAAATPAPEAMATLAAIPPDTTTPPPTSPSILEPIPTPVVSPAQSESSPVSILMASTKEELGPGQQLRVDLSVDPQGKGISGVQVRIEYDPAVFRVVGAEPGTLLGPEPAVAGPIIDETKGDVEYAAARIGPTEPPTPPGLFATLKFLVLETAPSGKFTILKISEVKIPDENIREIRDVLIGKELEVKISP